jgi:ADP-heptose:LPS heptosyltransferase
VAVLRANALGDFVMTLPALDAVRAAYPRAEIVLLGKPWHAEFLRGRPGPVDRVEVLPPVPGLTAPEAGPDGRDQAAARRFVQRMRAESLDLALQLHGGGRTSNPFVSALGARVTAGLKAPDAPPLHRWVPYLYYQSEVMRFLEVAGLVGAAPVRLEPVLEVTDGDLTEADQVLETAGTGPAADLVALHPGATDSRRRWPADRFSAVGDALAARAATVVVTGTAGEADLVAEVVRGMRHPAIPLVDAVSIGGLLGLYRRCRVVVSNDTGPLHVAQAVGTRTVGIYWCGNLINAGPSTRSRHRPLLSWTVHCPECGADCTRDLYPARTGAGTACRHRVSFVADVPVVEARDAALELYEDSLGARTARDRGSHAAGVTPRSR